MTLEDNQEQDLKEKYLSSRQVEVYSQKRSTLEELYESERETLKMLFGKFESVLDIGCCCGNLSKVFLGNNKNVKYFGVDLDPKAISVGRKLNPKAELILADFLKEPEKIPKADLVVAFNVLDQYKDWKKALKAICGFSNEFANFSTLLRLEGETCLDEDTSYTFYMQEKNRERNKKVLWAVHNVFSLVSYCVSPEIGAGKALVYCHPKKLAWGSSHPLHPKDLYVGNVVLEFPQNTEEPKIEIIVSGNTYYSNAKRLIF